jgi:non-ribosomal peptide synthetase component F
MALTRVSLVHQFLLHSAERFPSKEAVVSAGGRVTYAELLARAGSISAWLIERGLAPGDRVGILMDEPRDYIASYFGVLMAAGTVVPLNTQTSSRLVAAQLGRCETSVVLTHRKFSALGASRPPGGQGDCGAGGVGRVRWSLDRSRQGDGVHAPTRGATPSSGPRRRRPSRNHVHVRHHRERAA